ncbi:MAG: NAD(P)/FAD-dependent oxidoreductase [Planctomycetes bacterium]|nr:NAD(P)/FAD-dependent oxidoreductase [Planctomycetota bacterium]
MVDAVVIGAGPNGLVAAAALARHGWSVLLLEAQNRPGGALYSEERTLPGYLHDVGAAFFPFADSPAFQALDLAGAGVTWRHATWESCHPAPDGTWVGIARDPLLSAASFGEDGPVWQRLVEWRLAMGDRFVPALLAPLPGLGPAWQLGPLNLWKLGRAGLRSPAGWSRAHFRTEAARRVIPGLALHVDLGPENFGGAALGLVLALLAASSGFGVPVGGARALTQALVRRLEEAGGTFQPGKHVDRILVREGRAAAVRTSQGEEIAVRRAVLADVGAPALFLKMLDEQEVSAWLRRSMQRFRYGWGTFKMDWALAGPVPWSAAAAREAAVVHLGDSVDDLVRFARQVEAGELPTHPYLLVGQQSLLDPSRAPTGGQTLYAYTHVPATVPEGWPRHQEAFADLLENRIEELAPGFKTLIRARAIQSPEDLEKMDENLVGGDLGGGSNRFRQLLFFRPAFPYFRYRTPIRGLYLASASAHPGAGVHGACGWNAARIAIRDGDG